jgi:hypothetical protein
MPAGTMNGKSSAAIVFERQNATWMSQRPFLIWCVPISAVGFAVLWLRGVWVANANDKQLRDHFLFEAVKIFRHADHIPARHPEKISGAYKYFGFLSDWAAWFQLLTTAFLAAVFYLAAPV